MKQVPIHRVQRRSRNFGRNFYFPRSSGLLCRCSIKLSRANVHGYSAQLFFFFAGDPNLRCFHQHNLCLGMTLGALMLGTDATANCLSAFVIRNPENSPCEFVFISCHPTAVLRFKRPLAAALKNLIHNQPKKISRRPPDPLFSSK